MYFVPVLQHPAGTLYCNHKYPAPVPRKEPHCYNRSIQIIDHLFFCKRKASAFHDPKNQIPSVYCFFIIDQSLPISKLCFRHLISKLLLRLIQTMRILLVEDEEALSDAVAEILKQNHYQVDAVYRGDDGYDYACDSAYCQIRGV